jgi:hypothetical protein
VRRLPWYRRLGDLIGGGRDFRRSMRAANGGVRAVYSASMSVRAQMVRAVLLLGVLGIGVSQFGPWGGDLRSKIADRVDQIMPGSYSAVATGVVQTDPSVPALPGFDTAFAVDNNRERAWASRWQSPADEGTPCRRPGGAPTLLVTFDRPVQIDRVSVAAGLADGNPQRDLQARPRAIDVLFSDGTCQTENLTDNAAEQQFKTEVKSVTSVRLTVVEVYPPSDPAQTVLVGLGEVRFETRE